MGERTGKCAANYPMKATAFVVVLLASVASSAPTSPDAVVQEQLDKNAYQADKLSRTLKAEADAELDQFPVASSYDDNVDTAFAEATSSLHGLPMHVKKELARLGVHKYKKELTPPASYTPKKRAVVVTKAHKKKHAADSPDGTVKGDEAMMNTDADLAEKSSSPRTVSQGWAFIIAIAAVLVAQRFRVW